VNDFSSGRNFDRRTFLKAAVLTIAGPPVRRVDSVFRSTPQTKIPPLEEKIGSMLLVGFRGLRVDEDQPIVKDILHRSIGGVVLFDYDVPSSSPERNIESQGQLRSLVSSLQSFAGKPLIVAVDHEGGLITRLKEKFGFPKTFSAQFLGQKNDPEFTFLQAEVMAEQLVQLGVNLNLAPVVDLNVNPANPIIGRLERSFSEDPEEVVRHGELFIEAHHKQGVLCTLKHFPGHGSSVKDSHLGLVDISSTWSAKELRPYEELIKRGIVDAVMTAHVYNRHLDPDYPATLSRRIITGILREKLNYDGVVISDDMQMGAITKNYGLETAIFRAIEAGVDILAFANNSTFDSGIAEKAAGIIKKLVASQKISLSRIDESYKRIAKLKMEMNASDLNH
jgi:beta-N-acetylhexosaminidase